MRYNPKRYKPIPRIYSAMRACALALLILLLMGCSAPALAASEDRYSYITVQEVQILTTTYPAEYGRGEREQPAFHAILGIRSRIPVIFGLHRDELAVFLCADFCARDQTLPHERREKFFFARVDEFDRLTRLARENRGDDRIVVVAGLPAEAAADRALDDAHVGLAHAERRGDAGGVPKGGTEAERDSQRKRKDQNGGGSIQPRGKTGPVQLRCHRQQKTIRAERTPGEGNGNGWLNRLPGADDCLYPGRI